MIQHRRQTAKCVESDTQADFCFVAKNGKISVAREHDSIKCLALVERYSGSIGCLVMHGDITKSRRILVRWLGEVGLTPETSSILSTSDAAPS